MAARKLAGALRWQRLCVPHGLRRFSAATDKLGLSKLGITAPSQVFRNLPHETLYEHEVQNKEGVIMKAKYGETMCVDTGRFTGRSPKDKYLVKTPGSESEKNVWWGSVNQPTTPQVFKELYATAVQYFNKLDKCYVFDGFCGASTKSRLRVRFVAEQAWQQHFVTNMFIRPEPSELTNFEPQFTIINACAETDAEFKRHGLRSEVAVVFDIEKRLAVILGTWYGGENKKGVFSMMNYWLPLNGIMSMHCSANVGQDGVPALYFGLSGTGKTTLSCDPRRPLLGDDEHGWDDRGIFNFEGGCYAKTIALSEESEPDIYRAIRRDALLENVHLAPDGTPDYNDKTKTENGRVSFPIYHIENWHKPQKTGHPKNIIFLACDAFGVLPPVSKLTTDQAMYHFLSGYTAKVAGTEIGIKEPQATFSPCFGAAFLTLHPTLYADLMLEKMQRHNTTAYLVNTGWTGGPYGVGKRMSIKDTRACVNAILDGSLSDAPCVRDPVFGFEVPTLIPGVNPKVCIPRNTWADPAAYDAHAAKLAGMFKNNYLQYIDGGYTDYSPHGPI